jgi:hypothetical protein
MAWDRIYDPEKHDIRVGRNILQAYLETKNFADGEKLLHRLFALNRPDFKQHLMFYSVEFDKLKDSTQQQTSEAEPPVEASAYRLDRPIWGYGLDDPKWLFRSENKPGKDIVFLVLVNTSPTGLEIPTVQRENDLGRLTRSIPLYLLESFYYWTDMKPTAVIPVVVGKGPIVSGVDWPLEHILAFADGVADTVVAGSIQQVDDKVTIRLSVWDCPQRKAVKDFIHVTAPQYLGATILKLEKELLEFFDPSSARLTVSKEGFYVRPDARMVDRYLVCLGESLAMTLAQNEAFPQEGLWGERNMFEGCLATALEMGSAQVPRILFLSLAARNRDCGSSIYSEFKQQALALLEDEKKATSEFYRLSPLLYKVFDMHKELAQRTSELSRNADPLYRDWIDRLSKAGEKQALKNKRRRRT